MQKPNYAFVKKVLYREKNIRGHSLFTIKKNGKLASCIGNMGSVVDLHRKFVCWGKYPIIFF